MKLLRDVMTRSVYTIGSSQSVRQAAELMAEKDVGFLPVMHEGVSAGVLTDRDLVVRVMARGLDPDGTYVGSIVSTRQSTRESAADDANPGAATLADDTPVDQALRYMDERQLRRVTVHDRDYRITGIVSRADLPEATVAAHD
ncbi:MAG: CBS domain-containing protein [Maioricimonas sp. JB049]